MDDKKNSELKIKHDEKMKQREEISKLLLIIKGERSLRRFADDTGVSLSNLSKYVNKAITISPEAIKKITADEAVPRGGITYEDLMIVAGYISDYKKDAYEKILERTLNNTPVREKGQALELANKEATQQKKDKQAIKHFILATLAIKGFSIRQEFLRTAYNVIFTPDLKVSLTDTNTEWSFIIEETVCSNTRSTVDTLAKCLYVKPTDKRIISIVTPFEESYQTYLSLKDKIAYKGNLSIILINKENMTIEKEEYISSYYNIEETDTQYFIKE